MWAQGGQAPRRTTQISHPGDASSTTSASLEDGDNVCTTADRDFAVNSCPNSKPDSCEDGDTTCACARPYYACLAASPICLEEVAELKEIVDTCVASTVECPEACEEFTGQSGDGGDDDEGSDDEEDVATSVVSSIVATVASAAGVFLL